MAKYFCLISLYRDLDKTAKTF